jgi:hypothetical protein
MPEPQVAHEVAIHITAASNTALTNSNKLEESSTFQLAIATEKAERKLLNSDGWTKTKAVHHSGSGSMSGNVIRGSAAQGTMRTASSTGSLAYVHVIHTPDAETGEEKGKLYTILIESYEESFEAGSLVTFNASFTLDGAPTAILAS